MQQCTCNSEPQKITHRALRLLIILPSTRDTTSRGMYLRAKNSLSLAERGIFLLLAKPSKSTRSQSRCTSAPREEERVNVNGHASSQQPARCNRRWLPFITATVKARPGIRSTPPALAMDDGFVGSQRCIVPNQESLPVYSVPDRVCQIECIRFFKCLRMLVTFA